MLLFVFLVFISFCRPKERKSPSLAKAEKQKASAVPITNPFERRVLRPKHVVWGRRVQQHEKTAGQARARSVSLRFTCTYHAN